jgi:outer membrane murein-binding lipoprotein Lpp
MMKFVKVGAVALSVVFAAGCVDLKPLQAEVDTLKTQVAKLQGDHASMMSAANANAAAADGAARAAAAAQQAASAAGAKADQALAAATTSQQCCDATNEKIDRMFKRSMSK